MRAAAALRKGGTAAGRNRGKDGEGEEDGRWGWAASQVYALSVYETSRMFFSLHQVGGAYVGLGLWTCYLSNTQDTCVEFSFFVFLFLVLLLLFCAVSFRFVFS